MARQVMSFDFNGQSIETTITSEAEIASKWISQVRNSHGQRRNSNLVVGLDTEMYNMPMLLKEKSQGTQHAALLQLCVGTSCLVYQIYCADFIPDSLGEFLRDAKNTFVGVEVDYDARLLKQDFGLEIANTLDLRVLATDKLKSSVYNRYGLKQLYEEVLHVEFEKDKGIHSRTDWRALHLNEEQIKYACLDAAASLYVAWSLINEETTTSSAAV